MNKAERSMRVEIGDPAALRDPRRWRAGVIRTGRGKLLSIDWILWPRRISQLGVWFDRRMRSVPEDECFLYWHRPWFQTGVIALDYIRSGPRTRVATFHLAVQMLDWIAEKQGALAAVCHVTNERISDRLMERWGWDRHCLQWQGRHYIRRYYDGWPDVLGTRESK